MPVYQTRKRKYTSRQEKVHRTNRFLKIVSAFVLVGLIAFVFFRRRAIISWVQTYFMD